MCVCVECVCVCVCVCVLVLPQAYNSLFTITILGQSAPAGASHYDPERLQKQIDRSIGSHQTSSGMINAVVGGITTQGTLTEFCHRELTRNKHKTDGQMDR